MTPLEEILYRSLLNSKAFNRWVRRIHARINGIRFNEPKEVKDFNSYVPSGTHKVNAFKTIWKDEMKRSFGVR